MTRAGIYFFVFFMISTIAYNNCGGKFEVKNTLGSYVGSSQCLAKMRSSANTLERLPASACEDSSSYQCDIRRFRPNVISGETKETFCTYIGGSEYCVQAHVFNYDTSSQQRGASADLAVEGGSYNRDEVSCFHNQVLYENAALIQAEGSSLRDVLSATIEQCRQRSSP